METYGDIITGGVLVYLSPQDAPYVALLGAAGGALLCMALDGPLPFADAIGLALGVLIETVYWDEQNSDGSLNINIPYASAATYAIGGIAFVKIGSSWYML